MLEINSHHIFDISKNGKGSSVIFTSPLLLNIQDYYIFCSGTSEPDLSTPAEKPRLNGDDNGNLFINTAPNNLYDLKIANDSIKNGRFSFELVYDICNY